MSLPTETFPWKIVPEKAMCSHKQLKRICEQHTMRLVIAFTLTSKANSSLKRVQNLSLILPPSFILPFYPPFTIPILFLFLIVVFYMYVLHKPIWKAVRHMQISLDVETGPFIFVHACTPGRRIFKVTPIIY